MTSRYKPYPPTADMRVGNKVSWYRYATREEAETCAEAARHNAQIQSSLGYDFGYQCPGYIATLDDGRFEVTIP